MNLTTFLFFSILTNWDKGVYKYDGEIITNYAVKDGTKFQSSKKQK